MACHWGAGADSLALFAAEMADSLALFAAEMANRRALMTALLRSHPRQDGLSLGGRGRPDTILAMREQTAVSASRSVYPSL
jgi:hypothetical protein